MINCFFAKLFRKLFSDSLEILAFKFAKMFCATLSVWSISAMDCSLFSICRINNITHSRFLISSSTWAPLCCQFDDRKSRYNHVFHYPNGLEKSFLCNDRFLNNKIFTVQGNKNIRTFFHYKQLLPLENHQLWERSFWDWNAGQLFRCFLPFQFLKNQKIIS